jgi:hypothetical protein
MARAAALQAGTQRSSEACTLAGGDDAVKCWSSLGRWGRARRRWRGCGWSRAMSRCFDQVAVQQGAVDAVQCRSRAGRRQR